MPQPQPSGNIFAAPIAVNAPASIFPVRKDHPVPRKGIKGPGPHHTNKFYGNFNLGNQNAPTFVHPYSVAWAKGQGSAASWGLGVSHIEANQRVYGTAQAATGAVQYYLNPVGIQSLCLSATELGPNTVLTVDQMAHMSVKINLHAQANDIPAITFPLVQGMGYVTAIYNGSTPAIETGVFWSSVLKSQVDPKPGVTKYTINLNDGKQWHLYAYALDGVPLDLTVRDKSHARATRPFSGVIQIAKDPGGAEPILDASAGVYATGVALSGSVAGSKGSYTFKFQKSGHPTGKLFMHALPHHVECFDKTTHGGLTKVRMQTTTKGLATGVLADLWTMIEPNMPVSMGFDPWDPVKGPKTALRAGDIQTISKVAAKEIAENMDAQSNLNSMYFSGKALAKFAFVCYSVHGPLRNNSLAYSGLANLKQAFARFATNRQQFPLYYESAWGGLVSSSSYLTGNTGEDFGNTLYNDHHFHYGYFILAAAIIGHLDPSWLTGPNVDYINTMVRDIANPSSTDKYFPISRNFDWYHGHSWAHGLFETMDGKDQESSSEDAMHAYAIKMWGHTIRNADMEARGNLMLSIQARSLAHYYLFTDDNTVQPANFVRNRVAGILFENKLDHTTYFGTNMEYIQGIHMLPLLASTKLTRSARFVEQEWRTYFDNGRVDTVPGGWRGILYANLATVNPQSAWAFFTRKDFDPGWLDGGASLTWYLVYAAAFMA